ncbi:hypothetical protein GWK47_018723 [Chionoecetes opilio]|uniref:Uncharacterized protein n=1 Tax=Chionoecetes opilio TaxID=41210 RepID=A0A8J4XQM8_CHIOP|nr:hypothetical protein GWK47_018723 [Chionoecetes opilio]
MAASLPVVISCSRPRATCPLHSMRTLWRKCLWRVAYCWGTSAYPNVAPGYTHGSHPRCRGQHATPGNHHLSGLRGDCLHHRVLYIAEGVQQLYLSLKACKALRLVHHTFPRPLSPTSVCAVEPPDTPQDPRRPESPPHELVEENVDRLEKWFLEHFGRTVFAMGRTPLPEMSGPPHQRPPTARHTPPRSPRPSLSPAPLL